MKYQHIHLQINTLSPLHIGNGENLTSVGEYHNTGKQILIIDKDKLHKYLKKKHLVDDYYRLILDEGKETDVWQFLKENEIDITSFNTQRYVFNADDFDAAHNRFLELFIETAKQKYIPGSSIKGTLRHYLFLYLIDTNNSLKSKIENIIFSFDDLKTIREKIKKLEQKEFHENDSYNYSDFTLFRPEDSQPIQEDNFVVEVANRQSFFEEFGDLGSLRLSVNTDVDIPFVLTIKSSKHLKATFKEQEIIAIFNKINRVVKKYLTQEISFIKRATNPVFSTVKDDLNILLQDIPTENEPSAIMRMGKGRSFYFNTLLPFISADAQKKVIRLLIANKVAKINEKINDKKLHSPIDLKTYINNYPQTRVLTANNKTFGWVKLSVISTVNNVFDRNNELKKSYINNSIKDLELKQKLIAYYKGNKKVDFILNGKLHENFTLTIDKFIDPNSIPTDKPIKITVWQLKKTGELSQVKLTEL